MSFGKLAATAATYRTTAAAKSPAHDPTASASSSASSSVDARRRPLLNDPPSTSSYGAATQLPRSDSPDTVRSPRLGHAPMSASALSENGGGGGEWDDVDVADVLEDHGLFVGSYRSLIRTALLVPLSTAIVFIALGPLPAVLGTPAPPAPASLWADALVGSAFWVLTYVLGPHIYSAPAAVPSMHPHAALVLSALVHSVLRNALRVAGFVALGVTLTPPSSSSMSPITSTSLLTSYSDPAFARIWAFALGCATTDAIAGSFQYLAQLALYRDVLVPPADARALVAAWLRGRAAAPKARAGSATGRYSSVYSQQPPQSSQYQPYQHRYQQPYQHQSYQHQHQQSNSGGSVSPVHDGTQRRQPLRLVRKSSTGSVVEARLELERDLDALVAFKAREDLRELYGTHIVHVPVIVSCLLRVASIVLIMGFTLILSAAYLTSPLAPTLPTSSPSSSSPPSPPSPSTHPRLPSSLALALSRSPAPFYAIFTAVCTLYTALALALSPPLLARIGAHVVAYGATLVGLAALFGGLAVWGVLS